MLRVAACVVLAILATGCNEIKSLPTSASMGPTPTLPAPQHALLPTVNVAPATVWPVGVTPQAAAGTRVVAFARALEHPRWLLVLPNGDVLVAQSSEPPKPDDAQGVKGWLTGLMMKRAGAAVPSANRIALLRDTDGDGVADVRSVLLQGLNSPFGMALVRNVLYVANTDAVLMFPYVEGATRITAPGTKLVDLPAGRINHHWTKNLIASHDGARLYVTVGSNSNVGERGVAVEAERAAVNERDELGDDLVPDYMTKVRDGGFYGWPYSYFGQHVDARVAPTRADLVARALVPDFALGAHTASLGLANAAGSTLPARFAEGMFVGQHGSWNRTTPSGYKVIFVPFTHGVPAPGVAIDVLTGFLGADGSARGRPVGVALDMHGALLVADDVGNTVWRISAVPAASSLAAPR